MEPEELAAAIKRLTAWAEEHAPEPEPELRERLRAHFGADPTLLPIVTRRLMAWDRPNFQVAIDAFLAGRSSQLLGLSSVAGYEFGLAELAGTGGWHDNAIGVRAPEHVTIPLGEDESITCVQLGLWLVGDAGERLAIMLASSSHGMGEELALEVMSDDRERAEAVLAELWRLMNERNVYRGRVLELRPRHFHGDEDAPLTVRALPPIAREQIVLPEGVLERIERTTFGMSRHAERLRASGRHMRRGLLLHGPPGVGKTLTAMYLATQMPDRTVVLLTGQGLGTVTTSVDLATALAPAIVILEDVDLVAMERSFEPTNAILFELLNAMDGLDADRDVLFVLTTNAPERIEPALAARPGRIDQAVELPLPDGAGRRRLLALYGEGLELELGDAGGLVDELAGTSPAFIRELLRRSALVAADESDEGPLRVSGRHLREALAELRAGADELTRTLLGGGGDGELDA
jgi:ATPase family associated with various cellular activities (AAA)